MYLQVAIAFLAILCSNDVLATYDEKAVKSLLRLAVFGLAAYSCYPAMAEPQCRIDDSKRRIIEAFFCGQMAPEPQYRFTGPNCIAKSTDKRMEDTAIQIYAFRICGDLQFADDMKRANEEVGALMSIFSPCLSERVDVAAILDEKIRSAADLVQGKTCTAHLRSLLAQRKPEFQRMVEASKHTGMVTQIALDRLGLKVDQEGNVVDK